MYVCYIDESGTPDVPGNTSHFVLAGIAIPIWHWRDVEREITFVLRPYGLAQAELHTGWLIRPYLEQSKIPNFATLNWGQRRSAVGVRRNTYLLQLQKSNNHRLYMQVKKNYRQTEAYTHLTYDERKAVVKKIAELIANWGFARLFAECIDKLYFDPVKTGRSINEQAFEQVVSRFEQYITKQRPPGEDHQNFAIIVHDINHTVAQKHSKMMRQFFEEGTLWTKVNHIVETPFFVDSRLTRMVQIADVCAWALRRYCENQETELFELIFARADRQGPRTVGVRHYSNQGCGCLVCKSH